MNLTIKSNISMRLNENRKPLYKYFVNPVKENIERKSFKQLNKEILKDGLFVLLPSIALLNSVLFILINQLLKKGEEIKKLNTQKDKASIDKLNKELKETSFWQTTDSPEIVKQKVKRNLIKGSITSIIAYLGSSFLLKLLFERNIFKLRFIPNAFLSFILFLLIFTIVDLIIQKPIKAIYNKIFPN